MKSHYHDEFKNVGIGVVNREKIGDRNTNLRPFQLVSSEIELIAFK